jgi:hypothetical protein
MARCKEPERIVPKLYDAPSGFRELGMQDPDGHDIAVGQPIEQASPERN